MKVRLGCATSQGIWARGRTRRPLCSAKARRRRSCLQARREAATAHARHGHPRAPVSAVQSRWPRGPRRAESRPPRRRARRLLAPPRCIPLVATAPLVLASEGRPHLIRASQVGHEGVGVANGARNAGASLPQQAAATRGRRQLGSHRYHDGRSHATETPHEAPHPLAAEKGGPPPPPAPVSSSTAGVESSGQTRSASSRSPRGGRGNAGAAPPPARLLFIRGSAPSGLEGCRILSRGLVQEVHVSSVLIDAESAPRSTGEAPQGSPAQGPPLLQRRARP